MTFILLRGRSMILPFVHIDDPYRDLSVRRMITGSCQLVVAVVSKVCTACLLI